MITGDRWYIDQAEYFGNVAVTAVLRPRRRLSDVELDTIYDYARLAVHFAAAALGPQE
jgi:hypothetical protein